MLLECRKLKLKKKTSRTLYNVQKQRSAMETAMSGRSRQRRHKEERLNVTLEDDQGHRVGDMMGERSRLVERRTKLSRRSSICAIAATPALTRMQAPSPVIVSQLTKLVGQARRSRRMPAIVNNFNSGAHTHRSTCMLGLRACHTACRSLFIMCGFATVADHSSSFAVLLC